MSKPANPLELVERYLQAVRFWLPKAQTQEDLLVELGDDLRSQIEAQEGELGRRLEAAEVSEILKRCGSPMVVAGRFSPNRYLIGPTLYPIYKFVLKMVLFWILVPVFVFIVGPATLASTHGDWGAALTNTISALWTGLFIAAGVITMVFAILERTHALAAAECKWDPLKLPPVKQEKGRPSMVHTVCELAFGAFGLVWLLLLPQYPALILGPAAAFLKAAPMWHPFYIPIVLLSVIALMRSAVTLARPDWEWFPPLAELVQTALSLILVHFILNAARTSIASGQSFLVLTEAARNSAQYIKVAVVVNISILISLVGGWLGLCIAVIVQLWKLLSYLRKRVLGIGTTAPLQVR